MVSRKEYFSRLLKVTNLIALICAIPVVQGRAWIYEEVPYPGNATNGQCGHSDKLNYVCDPDMFLSSKEAESIERQLSQIREGTHGFKKMQCFGEEKKSRIETGPEVYAVVLESLRRSLLETGTKDLRACRFATKLIRKWGVGDVSCGYGVIVLISVRNRALAVSPTTTAKLKLTNAMKEGVKDLMFQHVRDGDLGQAFNVSVNAVGIILSDLTPPFTVGYSLGTILQSICALGMLAMIGLMCYIACSKHHLKRSFPSTTPGVERIIGTSSIDYGYQAVVKKVETQKLRKKNEYEICAICRKDIEGGTWDVAPEDMFCTERNGNVYNGIDDDDPLRDEIIVNIESMWRRLMCDHPVHAKCYETTTGKPLNPLDIETMMCQKCWDRSN
ncbi:Modulator of levamisole receptor-1 [Gracilaria domingensis]|nr:Modulator of levamisole receptor-1 [Gracilaria domingensis]